MKQWLRKAFGLSLALCVMAATCFAAESEADEEETIKVMAVGMGKDSDAALKNALKNAVSQAVGTLVDTQTIIENDAVIKDQILSHSGGFVEDYTMIGSPEAEDGLVSVKIDAVVKKMNLKRKMEAANIIHVEKIDGKLYTRQIQVDEANAMFYEMVKDFPRNCLEHKMVGKPYYDDKNKRLVVEIKTTLDTEMLKDLTKRMAAFLEEALPEAPTTRNTEPHFSSYGGSDWKVIDTTDKNIFFYPVFMSADKSKVTWKLYSLTDGMVKVLKETVLKRPSVTLDLTIDGDISILSETYWLPIPYRWRYDALLIMPMLDTDSFFSSNFQHGSETTSRFTFDLAPEDVQQIKDVKMRLN